jgi:hypothetical protein
MGERGGEIDSGALFRAVHRGCWRADAPPLELETREVAALMPLLIRSGSVGLIWPRLRHRAADYGAIGAGLEAAYQAQVAHNAKVEREIARVVGHLQEHGIDPVLIKGWAVARLYPAGLVRPAGDIDLVVRDADYERAKTLLASESLSLHRDRVEPAAVAEPRQAAAEIDLHRFSRWAEAPAGTFFADAPSIAIGDAMVRVPSAEDHLHVLCVHFLRHSGKRPLRLSDIAIMLEQGCPAFDWDRVFGEDARKRRMVECTLGLARRLAGIDVDGLDAIEAARPLPEWLVRAVNAEGEASSAVPGPALRELRARPTSLFRIARRRWPDPVSATLQMGAPFDDSPRFPVQCAAYVRRLMRLVLWRFPRQAFGRLRQSPVS